VSIFNSSVSSTPLKDAVAAGESYRCAFISTADPNVISIALVEEPGIWSEEAVDTLSKTVTELRVGGPGGVPADLQAAVTGSTHCRINASGTVEIR
jgi:hypothetical protein